MIIRSSSQRKCFDPVEYGQAQADIATPTYYNHADQEIGDPESPGNLKVRQVIIGDTDTKLKALSNKSKNIKMDTIGDLVNDQISIPRWSILKRTLFNIICTDDEVYCRVFSDDRTLIKNILNEPKFLLRMCLFLDEPKYFLYAFTIEYLLDAGIDESIFNILFSDICCILKINPQNIHSELLTSFSEKNIFQKSDLDNIENKIIPAKIRESLTKASGNKIAFTYWGEISQISERVIIDTIGFNFNGVKYIREIWRLREELKKIQDLLLKGFTEECYSSFNNMVDTFLKSIVKNNRELRILKKRLGLIDGPEMKLREIGSKEGLSPEGIRRIEKKYKPYFHFPKNMERLSLLWFAIDDILYVSGGVCCIGDINEAICKILKWVSTPSDNALASFISLFPKYKVDWNSPTRILVPEHQCTKCISIGLALIEAVENECDGRIPLTKAIDLIQMVCRTQCDSHITNIPTYLKGLLYNVAEIQEKIFIDQEFIYTQQAWTIHHGRQAEVIEAVLLQAGRAMHYSEVYAEICKKRQDYSISEHNIHARIRTIPNIFLWDRGTFIHRNYVNISPDLICNIELDIIERLKLDVPYISVSGVYAAFKQPLSSYAIPSESALYSCLRDNSNPELYFPEYPYIMLKDKGEERLPIPLVLAQYVRSHNGIISFEKIRKYAVDIMCIDKQTLGVHFNNIPDLLRFDRGEYIHLSQLNIRIEDLEQIVQYIDNILTTTNSVSVEKIFKAKRITCKIIGISTPMFLHSMLQKFYDYRFNVTRYPSIRRIENSAAATKGSTIATEIANYIQKKQTVCNLAELYKYFGDILGYSYTNISNVRYNKEISYYSEGAVVHLRTIEWSPEKQKQLESLASSHLKNRESAGKTFGQIMHIYEYMYNQLPILPVQIPWTPTLLADLLSQTNRYRIIGNQKNAFISTSNSHGIQTLDDLLFHILKTEYDGAVKLDLFIETMRGAGIIQKNLTPLMLGAESRVIIDGDIVLLRELHDHVK